MNLQPIDRDFSVCKVRDYSQVDWNGGYCFLGQTDEENSLVCETDRVPPNTLEREDGWRGFRIQGPLDFGLIGILARVSTLLADSGIGIFVVSTYNTDYVFTKKESADRALSVLARAGYPIVRPAPEGVNPPGGRDCS